MTDPKEVAIKLLQATSMTDETAFTGGLIKGAPGLKLVDYYRIACHMLFKCHRCGTCCTTGDPIRLRKEDAKALARHLKIPVDKAVKKYTIPDPKNTGALAFKKTRPCRFYDPTLGGCKIYPVRPWSCQIFPFLGIYGPDEAVKVNESCPGSVEAMNALTAALEEARAGSAGAGQSDAESARQAKIWFNEILDRV
ncbi:MAG TPA: YkgJ family cysteine cluster protein [Methanotrichaceae archaeon]|nr:YkgJ family cysteine cluster protein [Methanotrichaceae archaeon]